MNWKREGCRVLPDGVSVYFTNSERPNIRLAIQKRNIPHAGGRSGTGQHTSFFVIVEKATLEDAKELAELIAGKS